MKTSTNDPFELDTCIRGLSILMASVHSDFYEFVYYLTFKKAFRQYYSEFNDPWELPIEDGHFFDEVDDPFVQNCLKAFTKIGDTKAELNAWFGIDEYEEGQTAKYALEGMRFKPYQSFYKRAKSYKKLKLCYERSLAEFIHSLFLYACALTAQSNKVPLLLKRQFNLTNDESFRLLNRDDDQVALLIGLMKELKKMLNELRLLIYTPNIAVKMKTGRSSADSKGADKK
ncbi:hypothetical protein H9X96_13225 [Pedobacter sp. N36a]|uniref:hypothetical protein n=1 Tax=Pedobacter sp. N36a TaxID=2767996 RepID=UPI00165730A2|nr:hypothetical protein [Pedobacter sp. N36a]MBC8986738.1 hypothetical protein [Pedobacter sp. N36a]